MIINNPTSIFRDHSKRYDLYEQVKSYYKIQDKSITYLEFGVAAGNSIKWWIDSNENENSKFYGFDTFEGLPEDWGGFYKKGDMCSAIPDIKDTRTLFVKGLFQDTLTDFILQNKQNIESSEIRIIHCDADLYSSTIFVLSQMYSCLKKGDIILFDEFNVPMHEFKAFKEFTDNFYIKLRPIAQVNMYYQTAFILD